MNSDFKNHKKIKALAINSLLTKNPKVSFLAEGHGNLNYLIEESGNKLILRLKKDDEQQFTDSLEREYVFLKYFESKGVNFCPKALYYNKKDNFLIESFLKGNEVSQKDFSKEQIDLFARQLYELFSLSVSEFYDFCDKYELKKFEYISPITSLKKYGFNRFEQAKSDHIPKEIIIWMKEKLNENLEYLTQLDEEVKNLGFSWGDIQSHVIISDLNNMSFYDFEHVNISQSYGLSYIKIHGKFTTPQFDYLVERCSHYFNKDKETILSELEAEEKITRVNDVVWAAMKWAKTQENNFKELTHRRIDLVDKLI